MQLTLVDGFHMSFSILGMKQLTSKNNGQLFGLVNHFTTGIITFCRKIFGVFVGH